MCIRMTSWREQCPKDILQCLTEEKERIASQTGRQTFSLTLSKVNYDRFVEAGIHFDHCRVTIVE